MKLCPLKFNLGLSHPKPINLEEDNQRVELFQCNEENCKWWLGSQCAINEIAFILTDIKHEMKIRGT